MRRESVYGSTGRGSAVRRDDAADVVGGQLAGFRVLREVGQGQPRRDLLDQRLDGAGGVLEQHPVAGAQRPVVQMADGRGQVLTRPHRGVRGGEQVAARDVQVVGEPDGDRLRGPGHVDRAAQHVQCHDGAAAARRMHGDPVPDPQHTRGQLARIAPVVGVLGGLRPDDVLHGEARRVVGRVVGDRHRLQVLQHGRPAVPAHVRGGRDHVVALQRGDRHGRHLRHPEGGRVTGELVRDRGEDVLGVAHQVHLVDGEHHVRDAQQRRHGGVPPGLLDDPVARVHQDDGQFRGGGTGDHVPGVLHMARRVRQDEPPPGGGEVAVGDVDGDALLPLGAQPVGEQRQVGCLLAAGREARETASNWSESTDLESCSRRPTRVDLPSSTLPAVANRSSEVAASASAAWPAPAVVLISRSSLPACGLPSRPRRACRPPGWRRARSAGRRRSP